MRKKFGSGTSFTHNFLDDEDDEFIRLKTLSEAKKILKTVDEPDAQIVIHTFCMYCMREQFIYGKKEYKKVFVCEKCNTEQAISS